MTMLEALEQVILPRGFVKITPQLDNRYPKYGAVYGKLVKPNITLRIYSKCDEKGSKTSEDPFLLIFVTKRSGDIVKIGSERRVHTHHFKCEVWQENLAKALDEEWETQLREEDPVCNKCDGEGVYHWTTKSGAQCSGDCNRCGGRGYQDFTDRRKNKAYDRHVEEMVLSYGEDQEGDTYSDFIPHWVPDPNNFRNPQYRQEAAKKRHNDD